MSEFETKTHAPADYQLEMLVAELESRFLAAEDAISDLRHAIRQLKSYRPPVVAPIAAHDPPATPPAPSFEAPAEAPATPATEPVLENGARSEAREEVEAPEATVEADASPPAKLGLDQETVGLPFWPGPKTAEPDEPAARIENYGLDSTSEASWPVARAAVDRPPPPRVESRHELPPEQTNVTDAAGDDEARREEVARLVAQMRGGDDEVEDEAAPEPAAGADDDARRRDVARMVAELRSSVDVTATAPEEGEAGSNGYDDAAHREEVARMVAEMREGGAGEAEPDRDREDEATREDVASMVAQMRAEMQEDDSASSDEEIEADADVRDEVRRAVEAARAEMASGYGEAKEDAGDKRFSFPDWQSARVEPSGPPVIVIKDPEGRVELARVYETLSRLECDENAALLNYTPHSVTVGLNVKASVPEVDALTAAVQAVFGRACKVDSDGVRVNVQIGKDLRGSSAA